VSRGGQPSGRGNPVLRFLDRSLAVVLLRALGALRRRRSRPDDPARIGIMKSTGIGDMVLATAVANDVVAAFPDADVVLFGSGENAGLARLVNGVRVIELPMTRPWAAVPALRRERLDALVDLGQWSRLEAVYSATSGARWTAGFDTPGQRRHFAYDAVAPHAPDVPELENYRALVARLGVESRSEPSLRSSPSSTVIRPTTTPYAVFHLWPGGFRSELREWPAKSWRELAARVAAEGRAIVLTGGPGDVERTVAFAESCAAAAGTVVSVAGRYGLSDLVDVLAGADCVVSVNTGVMHMAAATGVRTVGLNGPTSSTRWGPRGPRAVSVDSELPGCGFLNLGWEYDGQRTDCMLGIPVERVAAAALGDADA
jgi:heptosyltransferase III